MDADEIRVHKGEIDPEKYAAWLQEAAEAIGPKTDAELYAEPLQSTIAAAKNLERELASLLSKVPLAGPCGVSSGTFDEGWTVTIKLASFIKRLEHDLNELE